MCIRDGTDIAQGLYLGAVVDRATRRVVFMASTEGGVEIDKVSEDTTDKILKLIVDPMIGAQLIQGRHFALSLGFNNG